MTAALFSASSRKKQRISLESVTSLPAGNETVPSAIGSPGVEELAADGRDERCWTYYWPGKF